MKISKLKNSYFKYAKSFDATSNQIFLYSGNRVIVLDHTLNFITVINNLKNVYCGYLSPDKTKLLLPSIENRFYIVDLNDFTMIKCVINGNYKGNLEGMGCWGFDSNSVYIPVLNKVSMKSSLRKYNTFDMSFEDFLVEEYWIIHISFIENQKKYLIIGLDRDTHYWNLIWFDGKCFKKQLISGFQDAIINVKININENTISLFGAEDYIECDFTGNKINRERIKFLKSQLDINDIIDERINTVCKSAYYDYTYIGTDRALLIVDNIHNKIIGKQKAEFGITQIYELNDELIILSSTNATNVFKVTQ